jgi:multiple sugar transport system permease protein
MRLIDPKNRRLALLYLASALLLFWALAPIYWVAVSSISTRTELYARPYKVWFPSQPTLDHYVTLFTQGAEYRAGGFSPTAGLMGAGLRNSLVQSVSSAAVVTILSTLAGYIFARMRFRGKQVAFYFLMLLMPLPIWASLISLFFLMTQLGLIDTTIGMILLFSVFLTPLSVWLMSTFIRDIPSEIEDAAFVDGANRWQLLFRIIFPLARPGMIAVFLVALLSAWNNFLLPLIFTRTSNAQPLTVVLTLFIGQYEVAWEDMAAAAFLTMLPPFLMALFFQRYLVRGLSLGAVK